MSTTVKYDPKAYFHCAECNALQPRDCPSNEPLHFCIECSQIICTACASKHKDKTLDITPEELNNRIEDAYHNFMPHLFPENSQV